MRPCFCGGCEQCLRDQGAWGDTCEICGGWIDWDDDDTLENGHCHASCFNASLITDGDLTGPETQISEE